jgi:hypothetical protein
MPSLTDVSSVVFCECSVFFWVEFRFLWNHNKSTAFISKQHSLFLSHDDFHRGTYGVIKKDCLSW